MMDKMQAHNQLLWKASSGGGAGGSGGRSRGGGGGGSVSFTGSRGATVTLTDSGGAGRGGRSRGAGGSSGGGNVARGVNRVSLSDLSSNVRQSFVSEIRQTPDQVIVMRDGNRRIMSYFPGANSFVSVSASQYASISARLRGEGFTVREVRGR